MLVNELFGHDLSGASWLAMAKFREHLGSERTANGIIRAGGGGRGGEERRLGGVY